MVVSKEWVNENQKVVAVAQDTEENRQKRPGDPLMENKRLLLDEVLKNNPKLTKTDALITDQEIAILCDVLEGWGANLNADKGKVLDQLIAKGFVVLTDQESPAKYKITGKARQLLAERQQYARWQLARRPDQSVGFLPVRQSKLPGEARRVSAEFVKITRDQFGTQQRTFTARRAGLMKLRQSMIEGGYPSKYRNKLRDNLRIEFAQFRGQGVAFLRQRFENLLSKHGRVHCACREQPF